MEGEIERLAAEAAPEYVDEQDPSVTDYWRPESLEAVDWALSRVADLCAERAEVEAMLQAAVAKLQHRAGVLLERADRGIRFFEGRIREYAEAHRHELLRGGKKKSRDLMHGRIGWRKQSGGLRVTDKAEFAAWAAAQPPELGLTRIKVEPDMKAIRAHCEPNGVVPPGCEWADDEDVLHIEATGDALVRRED